MFERLKELGNFIKNQIIPEKLVLGQDIFITKMYPTSELSIKKEQSQKEILLDSDVPSLLIGNSIRIARGSRENILNCSLSFEIQNITENKGKKTITLGRTIYPESTIEVVTEDNSFLLVFDYVDSIP